MKVTPCLWSWTGILLWHTFCWPCQWWTLHFCQYSTNADETITSKRQLQSIAWQKGITNKEYHADNGVFASKVFKDNCDSSDHIPLVVLEHIIRMVLLNKILKQSQDRLGLRCCILLIIGQPRLMSTSGHRQLNMPYGFSTECLILQMVYHQMKSGPPAAFLLRNLIIYLVVQSMFLM